MNSQTFNIIRTTPQVMSEATGQCKKCKSEISLDAERCPECQYEPGKPVLGPIGSILGFILMMGAIFQILIGVLVLFTPFAGAPITSALVGMLLFVGAGSLQATVAIWLGGFRQKKAAEQPEESDSAEGDDETGSFTEELAESYEEGREKREERAERIQERVDALPSSLFSAGILATVLFMFTTFVLIGADFEFAGVQTGNVFVLPFLLSLVVLPFVVWIDVKRVNRIHESSHKWWAWVISSFIPLIGWLPALAWLVRRRSTVHNEDSESPDKAHSAD
jgi:hypothetical protein